MTRRVSLHRPRTAPSSGKATADESIPPLPMLPPDTQRLAARQQPKAPSRSIRADSGVLRDVDAWLDASLEKPSAPLMGGLSYWREGIPADTEEATNVQYAIPIVQEPDSERPVTSHSQQLKSFCRRAMRMPSMRKEKSARVGEADTNVRSTSTPILAIPYQGTGEDTELSLRRESPASVRLRELEREMERYIAAFGEPAGLGNTLRPAQAAGHLPREDSMGSFSSAPTYFSGLPPPSYRSRAASILTTSSFGCIDGMNPEQRELSQKRAARRQRGMKGRLRKLAQRANLSK
ncbi:hypothetical protein N0V90_004453 [Kalmusia sp. IMI 367209]|nr:hypothetical protein N0V90_004453 [Kalmusia sp. IMI 367209]